MVEQLKKELAEYTWFQVYESSELNQKFAKLWRKVYGENLCRTCKGGFASKYNLLMNQTIETTIEMAARKFIPKPNLLIVDPVSGDHITTNTMTDETAIGLLRRSKQYAQLFQSLPDGWEEMVSVGAKPIKLPEPLPKVDLDEPKSEPAVKKSDKKKGKKKK